ncbi:T9SS type A sorting domain-containing protein [Mangrovibacterium marinum]|uniref:Putative secreted protein (Por secretion system target) n=1 Tax=Mangrovibacterium marinum TaxID=1639118 RepID=A0A2T5BX74_9BACT|nr:T9SS type A sorting domain-containing protein [Mangrovibacterium marinum]PTN04492.1 putative secreted protein (Por secretion system target) [Mangrovibacterium marinum]
MILLLSVCFGNAQTEPSLEPENLTKVEKVYPNPMDEHIIVEITSEEYANATFILMDILGNTVQRWDARELTPGLQNVRLNLKNLHSGIYLLKVVINNKSFVHRLRKV